jgi:uncharacterized protein YggE
METGMTKIRRFLLCLLIIGIAPAAADEIPSTITVGGTGQVSSAPDRAQIRMAIESRGDDLTKTRQTVIDVTSRFLDFCKDLGLEDKQVRTTGLTIRPQYVRVLPTSAAPGGQKFNGYVVQRQLDVELKDLELIGRLMEGAVNVGVNEVYPPTLKSSRHAELRREAMAVAARDARANAEALAASMDAQVGTVIQLSSGVTLPPRPMGARTQFAMAEGVSVDDAAATYRTGEISISANVTAIFKLVAE